MPRDPKKVAKRKLEPDMKYKSILVSKIINKIMLNGKKTIATNLLYDAMEKLEKDTGKPALDVLDQAIKNISPMVQVKSRRIGGATYQVPMEVKGERRLHYAIVWVRDAARARRGVSFDKALAQELIDAYNNVGAAIKKREDTHKMAEANKAFAHFARY
ncbi:MAG: 30S ribosomal protein S7 [Patescibacteria group bacterium]|jgi:small subunit ribosomal protein S7|nr:30S ribosomal protein S7 [Patescibacteria group bacterium]